MTCPYCDFEGSRRGLHGHLAETHGVEVRTRADEDLGQMFYEIECPYCGGKIAKQVKPGGRDPAFLRAFEREIRLVAFDLLLYHLEADHSPAEPG